MENYEQLYYFLFNGITDIVKKMETQAPDEQIEQYILQLRQLQADAEKQFIEQ